MGTLKFKYRLNRQQWRILASGGPGLEGEAAFHYLIGGLAVEVRGRALWNGHYECSIADIALGFAQVIETGFPDESSAAVVRETDGGLEMSLSFVEGLVVLACNLADRREAVTKEEFVEGVESFLEGLVDEIAARAPVALEADELAALGRWRGRHRKGISA